MIRAFLLMPLLLLPTICLGDEVSDLVDGVVARSTAIKSGRMVWDPNWRVSGKGMGFGGKDPALLHYFSWSGDSWAEGGGGTSGKKNDFGYPARSNHDGYFLSGFSGYQISKAQPYHRRSQNAPIWAGTLREEGEELVFKNFKDHLKAIPDKDVEGVVSKGIEIRREDFVGDKFPSFYGKMRFYIAPQMGYVITSVEGSTERTTMVDGSPKKEDIVQAKAWNTDWHEVAPGIFMPYKIYCWDSAEVPGKIGPNDKVRNKKDYVIISATLINQPIPESDFRGKDDEGNMIEFTEKDKRQIERVKEEGSKSQPQPKIRD